MRHSMAHPVVRTSDCRSRRPRPSAIAICSAIEIDAGDRLGHGMLDLDARVHLKKIEGLALCVHDEFDRSGASIAQALREAHGGLLQ